MAGQFVMLQIEDGQPGKAQRAYSLACPPEGDGFSICVRLVEGGRGSEYLRSLKVGDEVMFTGPFGHFVLEDSKKEVVLVATGAGIAPFMSMIPVLLESGFKKPVILYFSASYEKELVYVDKFHEWEDKWPNFSAVLTLTRPSSSWKGLTGRVQEHLKDGTFDVTDAKFYICGRREMVTEVRALLSEMGAKKEDVHFEQF